MELYFKIKNVIFKIQLIIKKKQNENREIRAAKKRARTICERE